jgi:hypothetical protein
MTFPREKRSVSLSLGSVRSVVTIAQSTVFRTSSVPILVSISSLFMAVPFVKRLLVEHRLYHGWNRHPFTLDIPANRAIIRPNAASAAGGFDSPDVTGGQPPLARFFYVRSMALVFGGPCGRASALPVL